MEFLIKNKIGLSINKPIVEYQKHAIDYNIIKGRKPRTVFRPYIFNP